MMIVFLGPMNIAPTRLPVASTLNNLPSSVTALVLDRKTSEEKELVKEAHELMKLPNVIVTPHLAFYSKEGVQRIMDATLDNIFDYIENRGLRNKVKL